MRRALAVLALVPFSSLACAAPPDEEPMAAEQLMTPDNAATLFDQVKVCDGHVRSKSGVRASDLAAGVVRWKCGDVDGVDLSDGRNDFGQEYCEYHALVAGTNVDDSVDPPAGDVKCVYTSAFSDGDVDTKAVGAALAKQMSLDAAPPAATIKMVGSFNSRHAARVLVDDCAGFASASMTNAERQTACYDATKGANAKLRAQLRAACRDVDLSVEANWAAAQALGVRAIDDAAEAERELLRDIAYCAQSYEVEKAKGGAVVLWRNSDPTICGRTLRAAKECGDRFASLDDAKTLHGFPLTSWNDDHDPATPPQVPATGCEFATVDRAPFALSLVCTPPRAAIAQARLDRKPMQMLCNELYGGEVAMSAPLGAIATAGKGETPFCRAFHEGARALRGEK